MSWLTDQISSSAGATVRTFDVGTLTEVDASTVLASLYQSQTFFYCSEVPTVDAWGFEYEYRVNTDSLASSKVMSIRARARDGLWDDGDTVYNVGPFVTTHYDRDIVWADGLFVSYPQGLTVVRAAANEF
jgi:hypothetical protein